MSQNNKPKDQAKSMLFTFLFVAAIFSLMFFVKVKIDNPKSFDKKEPIAKVDSLVLEEKTDSQIIFIPEEITKPLVEVVDSTAKSKKEEKPVEKVEKKDLPKKEEVKPTQKKEEKPNPKETQSNATTKKILKYVPGTMGQAGKLPAHKCKLKGSITLSYIADKNGNVISVKRTSGLSDPCAVSTSSSWIKAHVKVEKGTANTSGTYKITF